MSNNMSNQQKKQLIAELRKKNKAQSMKHKPKGPSQMGIVKRQTQKSVAAAYATGQSTQPAFVKSDGHSCRIVHREFIGNVVGSVNYALSNTFDINPGLNDLFPWLSGIARNWETYRFRKLKFKYFTRTGSNVPGSVLMAVDPDSSDSFPATEKTFATYDGMVEDAPWKDMVLTADAKALGDIGPRKFVRTSDLTGVDIKLYDSGQFFVATVDGTAVPWGKLWVEYDVDFQTPQLNPSGNSPYGGFAVAGGAITAANPMGTVPVQNAQSSGVVINAASSIAMKEPGTYLVTMSTAGTVITAITLTPDSGTTVTYTGTQVINSTSVAAERFWSVKTTVPDQGFSIACTATTITASALMIAQAPQGSLS